MTFLLDLKGFTPEQKWSLLYHYKNTD